LRGVVEPLLAGARVTDLLRHVSRIAGARGDVVVFGAHHPELPSAST
jgi:hypothetical protein